MTILDVDETRRNRSSLTMLNLRARRVLAVGGITATAVGASADPALAGHPLASHRRSGEFCTKRYQQLL